MVADLHAGREALLLHHRGHAPQLFVGELRERRDLSERVAALVKVFVGDVGDHLAEDLTRQGPKARLGEREHRGCAGGFVNQREFPEHAALFQRVYLPWEGGLNHPERAAAHDVEKVPFRALRNHHAAGGDVIDDLKFLAYPLKILLTHFSPRRSQTFLGNAKTGSTGSPCPGSRRPIIERPQRPKKV